MTSLGVLYDFTGNDVNTTVQTVAKMVKEEWVSLSTSVIRAFQDSSRLSMQFTEAIKEEPDFFLLLGYVFCLRS